MILLDTHTLLWWANDSKKLSSKARSTIKKEEKSGLILISSISIWETYMLLKKKKISFDIDPDNWLNKLNSLPYIQFIPVDNKIAVKSVTLPGDFHGDPADRMIVATAREMGASIITKDQKIQKYDFVDTIW